MDWRESGACLQEDPDLFFPTGATASLSREIEIAKSVCRRCSVQQACLEWALGAGQLSGIWGGTTEDERRTWSRRRQESVGVRERRTA